MKEIEFYKVNIGQRFKVGNQAYVKVYNPFKCEDAQIINCMNIGSFAVCHCDDDEIVEIYCSSYKD